MVTYGNPFHITNKMYHLNHYPLWYEFILMFDKVSETNFPTISEQLQLTCM